MWITSQDYLKKKKCTLGILGQRNPSCSAFLIPSQHPAPLGDYLKILTLMLPSKLETSGKLWPAASLLSEVPIRWRNWPLWSTPFFLLDTVQWHSLQASLWITSQEIQGWIHHSTTKNSPWEEAWTLQCDPGTRTPHPASSATWIYYPKSNWLPRTHLGGIAERIKML